MANFFVVEKMKPSVHWTGSEAFVVCFDESMKQLRGSSVVVEWSVPAGSVCGHARGELWAAGGAGGLAWGRLGQGALRVESLGRKVVCVSVGRGPGAVAAGLDKGGGVALAGREDAHTPRVLNEAAASLEWVGEQVLLVGTGAKALRLYDLRAAGGPAVSVLAHDRAVDAVRQEEGAHLLTTLGLRESAVKVWDARSLRRPLVSLTVPGVRDACLRADRLAVGAVDRAQVFTLAGEPADAEAEREAEGQEEGQDEGASDVKSNKESFILVAAEFLFLFSKGGFFGSSGGARQEGAAACSAVGAGGRVLGRGERLGPGAAGRGRRPRAVARGPRRSL